MSPGEDIACAKFAKPSLDPRVTTISFSGFNFTPNLLS